MYFNVFDKLYLMYFDFNFAAATVSFKVAAFQIDTQSRTIELGKAIARNYSQII